MKEGSHFVTRYFFKGLKICQCRVITVKPVVYG